MWCRNCQQDVPGILSAEDDQFRCQRCGRELRRGLHGSGPAATDSGETDLPAVAADPWDRDEQFRHIERVLRAEPPHGRRSHSTGPKEVARLDPPHDTPAGCHLPSTAGQPRRAAPSDRTSSPTLAVLTWSALSLGTAAFVCGGVLLGWSLVAHREELWTLGVPIALGGQVALLIGLILQLDRIWHDGRRVAAKLADVDGRLNDLKTATTLQAGSHGSPGTAFYAHMAGGASPQLLLSDLKGQLERLATRLDQQEQHITAATRSDPPSG